MLPKTDTLITIPQSALFKTDIKTRLEIYLTRYMYYLAIVGYLRLAAGKAGRIMVTCHH